MQQFSRVRKAKEPPGLIFKLCLVDLWVSLCHMILSPAEVVALVHSVITKQTEGNSSDKEECDAGSITQEVLTSTIHSVPWRCCLCQMWKPSRTISDTSNWYPRSIRLHLRGRVDSFLNWIKTMNPLPSPASKQAHRHTDVSELACTCQEVPDSWSHCTCPQLRTLVSRSLYKASSGMFIMAGLFERGWCHSS